MLYACLFIKSNKKALNVKKKEAIISKLKKKYKFIDIKRNKVIVSTFN